MSDSDVLIEPALPALPDAIPATHAPTDTFHCETFHTTMARSVCIRRQEARTERGGSIVHLPCGRGECAQGLEVRKSLGSWEAPPYREARPDRKAQRAARKRYFQGLPASEEVIDPFEQEEES